MPKFANQFEPHARIHANPGTPEKVLYGPVFDENGTLDLEPKGKENLYDYIQSHKDSCDIKLIVDRCARGDLSALSKAQGMYGDFTTLPRTYAEALQALTDAENFFMGLPVETRAKFDHDPHKFIASMDKPGFLEKLGVPVPNSGAEQQPPTLTSGPATAPASEVSTD